MAASDFRQRRVTGNGKPRRHVRAVNGQHHDASGENSSDANDANEIATNEPTLLPQDHRAESGLLDSAMQDPPGVMSACAFVKPDYFFQEQGRVIWRQMQELHTAGRVFDHTILADALRTNGQLGKAGGETAIFELGTRVTHPEFAREYARIICEKYLARYSIRANAQLAGASYRGDVQEIAAAWMASQTEMREVFAALGIGSGESGSRFRLKAVSEVISQPLPRWIIPGFLQERKLWMLYGDSNTGKSFLALDMGLTLATGLPWHGRAVRGGAVVYVCAEGMEGISGRLRAWLQEHHVNAEAPDFHVIDESPNLLDPVVVGEIISEVQRGLPDPPVMVIFDTLAASMPGADENNSESMSAALAALRRVQRECGCGVMLVHHSGKDQARGPRGHSSLRGAFDAALEVSADEYGLITLRANKGRDFKKNAPESSMGFRLKDVAVGDYADFTSCILEALDEPPAPAAAAVRRKPTASDKLLALMQEIGAPQLHGQLCTAFIKAGHGNRASFNRAIQELYDRRLIENIGGLYQPVAEAADEN